MALKNFQNLFLVVIIFGMILFPFSILGLAQSVQPIIIENAQRGENYEAMISIFNTETNEIDVYLRASEDIESWASFFGIDDTERKNPIKSLIIEPQSYGYALVNFRVPDFIANGEYKGSVIAGTKPNNDSNENTAQIGFEIPRKVTIKIGGEQVILYDAEVLASNIFLPKNETFSFTIVYHNKGNVNIKPIVKFKAVSNDKEIANIIFPYPDEGVAIAPNSSRRMSYDWTPPAVNASNASYDISITPAVGDKEIKTETFTISVDNGVQAGMVMGANTSSSEVRIQMIMWYVLGGIATLAVLLALVKIFKKGKPTNSIINK